MITINALNYMQKQKHYLLDNAILHSIYYKGGGYRYLEISSSYSIYMERMVYQIININIMQVADEVVTNEQREALKAEWQVN